MDFQSVVKRQNASVKNLSLQKYKNAFESSTLRRKLQRQLESDILCLFETSQFVDLKLELPEGHIYSHSVIVAGRFPSCWQLLLEIEKIQPQTLPEHSQTFGVITIWLPSVNFQDLKKFIRSLYTNEVNEECGCSLKTQLENHLIYLQRSLLGPQVLYLEKLNHKEEETVEIILLQKIKKGEISQEKGNLRDVSHLMPSKSQDRRQSKKIKWLPKRFPSNPVDRSLILSFYSTHPSRIPVCSQQQHLWRESQCVNSFSNPVFSTMSSKNSVATFKKVLNKSQKKCVKTSISKDEGSYSCASSQASKLKYTGCSASSKSSFNNTKNDVFFDSTSIFPSGFQENESINHQGIDLAVMTSKNESGSCVEHLLYDESVKHKAVSGNDMQNPYPSSESIFKGDEINAQCAQEGHVSSEREPNGLHETSSLEVELPSSHEGESLSHDSCKSEEEPKGDEINDGDCQKLDANPKLVSINGKDESEPVASRPHKPLVRSRTFDLIEPTCATTCAQKVAMEEKCDSSQEDKSCASPPLLPEPADANALLDIKLNEDDPEAIRELERKKGCLLFEHNFQTFSNIPSTNMMTVNMGMNSEETPRINSVYNTMMDNAMRSSLHSVCSTVSRATHDTSYLSLSLPEMEHFLSSHPPLPSCPEYVTREGRDWVPQTGSPSPDSLCMDHISSTANADCEPNSLSKEDLNFEEKEKDEREEIDQSSLEINELNPHREELILKEASCEVGSPKLNCKDDSKPIVSGGSTLRKDSLKNIKAETRPKKTIRQVSSGSVKDVDAIPLVCGYISPEQGENSKTAKNAQEDEHALSRSMFSMFIDFNEIPSPMKDPVPEPPKTKVKPSGGMFMFIEADKVASPKIKRKNKPDSENESIPLSKDEKSRTSKTPNKAPSADEVIAKDSKETKDSKHDKDKKSFFVFVEADHLSKGNSPKLKRRQMPQKPAKPEGNVMSKSAPSNCLLFSKDESSKSSGTENSMKLMTKSVIDREEFMAQPCTRRNVSLNDKINESSKIPRPVSNFKEKLYLEAVKKKTLSHFVTNKEILHLKKGKPQDLQNAKSMDGSMSEAGTSMSISLTESTLPTDVEDMSEFSGISSLLSSIERSNEPSVEEGRTSQNALGDDLLKMLLQEINTDVVIQIGERKVKAHKCILASRCVYFAAMLSGHYVESAGNVIKLQGFSAEAVMVALKHIYSGSSTVPDDVKPSEIAALADMLALDGLKDVVAQHLKAKLCHYFHKPCADCVSGVLEVLPVAGAFCLEELYHKSLKWVAKHFVTIAPTRSFASLPPELQERILKHIMDDMSVNTVMDTSLGADQVLTLLPMVRWAQPVFDLMAQLLESATNFMATNLSGVFMSERFLELGIDDTWNVDSLEETLKMACEMVRPDQAVLSQIQLSKICESSQDGSHHDLTENFVCMAERLLKQIEKFIIHNANRVAVCRHWPLLPPETQKRIKDAALVVFEFSKPLAPKPNSSSSNKGRSRNGSTESAQRLRTSSMSENRLSKSASTTAVPPTKVHSAIGSKRLQLADRCHTPPPSSLRVVVRTPPPTRASTLRAQARQATIQRSQSARTVTDKGKGPKMMLNDVSTENESSVASSCGRIGFGFPRARTSSHGSFPTHLSTSRSSTPGLSDRLKHHRRNASASQLQIMNRNFHTIDDVFPSKQMSDQNSTGGMKPPRSSSIGASPLHHHLGSLRESLSSDQRKAFGPCRTKSRACVERRLRSPLRENHCVTSPSNNPKGDSCLPRRAETSKGPDHIVIGLGSRSNTFCMDDKPVKASAEADVTPE